MEIFACPIDAISVSAVQDLWEFNSSSTRPVRLLELVLGQSSDAGDAQDELLQVKVIRAHSTSGSGGGTITPLNLDPGGAAFGGTVERNNTTQATGGSPVTMLSFAWNVRAGYIYKPPRDEAIIIAPSSRLVVAMTAPADAITFCGYALIGEGY